MKVESTGLSKYLDVESEEKRRIKDDFLGWAE